MTATSVMASRPEFIRQQYAFAAHIRDPEHAPAPADVEDRRMAIYRELLYNNVESFLSNTFPVLRAIYDDTRWHALVREFFSRHHAQTPLFLEIPREFLTWLERDREQRDDDPAFLYELAHYEWTELALSVAEESVAAGDIDPQGDLLAGIPVLSPLAWHLSYRFPVHEISPDNQPAAAGEHPTHLVVYRNRDDAMGFMLINAVTKRLLELVDAGNGESGAQLLGRIAQELSHPQPAVVIAGGREILEGLAAKDIILGTRTG